MIDFHCHVLMGIDDGSRNLETSASMLEASKTQGVQQIVCTPHFDATKDRMEEFLINRDHAFQVLQKWIDASDAVDIRLYPAAEVFFFPPHERSEGSEEADHPWYKRVALGNAL